MKKRRKDDDDSCLVQFVKTILLLACVYWGLITAMRTVDDSWWLIGGIAVVSYLLVKLFKDDDYVSMHTCTLAVVLGGDNLYHKLLFPDFYATTSSCYPRPLRFGRQDEDNAMCSSFYGQWTKGKCQWRIQQGRLSCGRHRNRYLSARMPRNGCGEIRQMI